MTEPRNPRREFLKLGALAGAATLSMGSEADDSTTHGIPHRTLGKTGEKVPCLCLGGWHIGSVKDESEAIRIMHAAIDEGLTFFDNAWDYHSGGSEEIMGKALSSPDKRDKVFLMTKNCERDAKGTRQCLEDSLRRLQTDRIDLWQFHEINYDNDPDWIVDKGALEEALKAKEEGKIRYIGFTGNKSPDIHLKMLEKYAWDTVQMRINVCDYFYRSFIHEVVPRANARGIAPIGMKSLCGNPGPLLEANACTVEEAIRFALGQPIASLVTGIESMKILNQNIAIARSFKPMEPEEFKPCWPRSNRSPATVVSSGSNRHRPSTRVTTGNSMGLVEGFCADRHFRARSCVAADEEGRLHRSRDARTDQSLFQQTTLCVAMELIPWQCEIDAKRLVAPIHFSWSDRAREGFKPPRYTQSHPLKQRFNPVSLFSVVS